MQGSRGVEWARRVVLTKIGLTLLIAAIGSLMVYIGSGTSSRIIIVAGLAIVALSPVISYLIIYLHLSRRA